jgi:uncharacterized membrane protein
MFQPKDRLDRLFEIGIIAKGLNGLVEVIGGLLLLFVTPARVHWWAVRLTQEELSEDPHDFIANHLLHTASGITGGAVLFGSLYLLSHGVIKIFLVVSLLRNKLWAYPLTIVVLSGFGVYQLYRIALHVSFGMVALTVFDLVIIALTIREYKRQREARRNPPEAAGAGDGSPTATAGGDTKPQAGSQANATVAGATDPAASRRSQR